MSEFDINKYVSGEMSHYTDPNTGITWHNAKFVEQLKQENEALKQSEQEGLEIIAELEAENNKLKKYVDRAGVIGIIKVLKCLDEIEEMCKYDCEYECSKNSNECGICSCLEQRIQRKIKEVKENERI